MFVRGAEEKTTRLITPNSREAYQLGSIGTRDECFTIVLNC